MHWLVMQSLKHRKWVLAVIQGTFEEYYVTDIMSENVDLIIQCADYLNRGVAGSAIDNGRMAQLDRLREKYST